MRLPDKILPDGDRNATVVDSSSKLGYVTITSMQRSKLAMSYIVTYTNGSPLNMVEWTVPDVLATVSHFMTLKSIPIHTSAKKIHRI